MAQHVGDGLLGDAKQGEGHVFVQVGQALVAFKGPVQRRVFQRFDQVRTQADFNSQACDLPRVKRGRHVAHFGQGFFEHIAQAQAMALQVFGHAPLQPADLQGGGGQELPDVIMQFAAEVLTFTFLNLNQPRRQLFGLQFDGAA